jgi:cytochrome c-type biogenesis protein CcmH
MLGLSGVINFGQKAQGSDISVALKELLLARAEGRIDQDEFERSQAALHASLLDMPVKNAANMSPHLRWVVPVFFIVAAGAVVLFNEKPKEADVAMAPATSSRVMLPSSNSSAQPSAMTQKNLQPGAQTQAQSNSGGDLNTMVKRLADKMLKNPNNGDGWLLLARTYGELRQHKEAANAYAKAAAILPPDAALLADWADARVVSNDRKWDAESRDIVKRALTADPKHLKSLSLAGSEAFDRADYKQAIGFWKRILAVAPADSMDAKLAEKNIQEANDRLAGKKPS